LKFGEEYFENLEYSKRELLIRNHVLEALRWGSKVSYSNLLDGQGKAALDVGCAYGYAVDILRSLCYETYGVDISGYSVKKAKQLCSMDFLVCDMQKGLPFEKDTFDLLTCFEVLEHLTHPLSALENMFALCKGIMICTTPNRVVEKPVKKLVRDYDKTHISAKTQNEWEKYIKSLRPSYFRIEPFFDANLKAADKLLFFKSFKIPYFGLNLRILIKK